MSEETDPVKAVEEWNNRYKIGQAVLYWPGALEGDGEMGVTSTDAWVLVGHTAVVWIEGVGSCMALDHVHALYICEHKFVGCLMPGPHTDDECHDVEMYEAYNTPEGEVATSRETWEEQRQRIRGKLDTTLPLTVEEREALMGMMDQHSGVVGVLSAALGKPTELLDIIGRALDVAEVMDKERADVLADASVVTPNSKAALHQVYSDLVGELEYQECNDSGASYESAEEPGNCICGRCQLHRISDRLWAVVTGASDE